MSNRLFTRVLLIILCVSFMAVGALAKVDFSGSWKIDAQKSEGYPPGLDQTMVIKQTEDKIDIEVKVKGPHGEQTIQEVLIVNGKETEYSKEMPNDAVQKGKRTAKWTEEGLESTEAGMIEAPGFSAPLNIQRKWRLSADKKTLNIDLNIDGPNGKQIMKLTFVRI